MRYYCLLAFLFISISSNAQHSVDSVVNKDVWQLIHSHPYFNFDGEVEKLVMDERSVDYEESIFYFIVSLVLYLALMRLIFTKYMSTMFTLFFRASLRQQQLREQMLQAKLPALLMNIFFVIVFATYCTLLTRYYGVSFAENFWQTLSLGIALIACIYIVKFIILNIVGWILGIKTAREAYVFLVFLVNKMMSIFLLGFVILLAFPAPQIEITVLTLSYILVAGMFIYRFFISYLPLRSEIKLSRLHFFLYLCAFEIAPLLLIYKVLMVFER